MYATVITQCFKTTTSISQKITLTKLKGNNIDYDLMSWSQYKYLIDNIQTDQKNMQFKDKEMFVWSFCVIIATKIVKSKRKIIIHTPYTKSIYNTRNKLYVTIKPQKTNKKKEIFGAKYFSHNEARHKLSKQEFYIRSTILLLSITRINPKICVRNE